MKLKINNFKGIYTNENEVTLPSEYCRSTTAKITPIGLESTISKPTNTLYTSTNKTLLFASEIILDDDFATSVFEDGEFKNTYIYNPEYFLCVIEDNEIKLLQDGVVKFTDSFEGSFIKAINHKGRFYFLTDTDFYELGKYNRTTNRIRVVDPNEIGTINPFDDSYEFYKEIGIFLKKVIEKFPQTPVPILDIKRVYENTAITDEVTLIFGEEGGVDIPEGSYYYIKLLLVDKDGAIINSIFFSSSLYTKRYSEDDKSTYVDSIFFPQANTSNYRVVKLSDMYPVGASGAENWNAILEGITIASKYNNLEQLKSILNGRIANYKSNIELNENTGFPNTSYETYYMHSFLLDDNTEIPLGEEKLLNITGYTDGEYHIYKITPTYRYGLSTKVIAHRVYIKNRKDDPYELIYERSFYDEEEQKKYYTINDLSGIFSSQTMGVSDPFKYKIADNFEDFSLVNGIFFMLTKNNVYYPVVGNGVITKLYWDINVIPQVAGTLLMNINNSLGVAGSDRTYIINTTSEDGILIFNIKDEIGFNIKDKYDIQETADGTILNTSTGIYITNGTELRLLSDAINDFAKKYWKNTNILYDSLSKELWLVLEADNINFIQNIIFKYSFELNAWISVNGDNFVNAPINIYIDKNSDKFIVSNNGVNALEEIQGECAYFGLLTSLGYTGYLKSITQIDFDFVGKIGYFLNGKEEIIEASSRNIKTVYKKLKRRYMLDYESWTFILYPNTVLYNLEINFEVNPKKNEYRS